MATYRDLQRGVGYFLNQGQFSNAEKGEVLMRIDSTGWCPLHYAVAKYDSSVLPKAAKIPESHIDWEIKTRCNLELTPFLLAAYKGDNWSLSWFRDIDGKFDPVALSKNGDTALHLAVRNMYCQFSIERLTEDRDYYYTMRNNDGKTPLHIAAELGNTEAIKTLLDMRLWRYEYDSFHETFETKTDVYLYDIREMLKMKVNGKNAAQIAKENGYDDAFDLLSRVTIWMCATVEKDDDSEFYGLDEWAERWDDSKLSIDEAVRADRLSSVELFINRELYVFEYNSEFEYDEEEKLSFDDIREELTVEVLEDAKNSIKPEIYNQLRSLSVWISPTSVKEMIRDDGSY